MQRIKRDLDEETIHELRGFPLGRLRVTERISEAEYLAGCHWAAQITRLARFNGFLPPTPRAVALEGSRGKSTAPEPDAETLDRLKSYCHRAESIILMIGGRRGLTLMQSTILCDRQPEDDVPLLELMLAGLAALDRGRKAAP
jgi:hypothetical protein